MPSCNACHRDNPDDARFCLYCGQRFPEPDPAPEPAPDTAAPPMEHAGEQTEHAEAKTEARAEGDGGDAAEPKPATDAELEDMRASLMDEYWRTLIGEGYSLQFQWRSGWAWRPAWEYYQRVFRQFNAHGSAHFAPTWNWAPFLIEPFLWFLYRKMYMFALIYLAGPIVSVYATGDVTVPLVWSIIASVSGNYVYHWHLKDLLLRVNTMAGAKDPYTIVKWSGKKDCVRLLVDAGGVQTYVMWLVAASVLLKIVFFVAMLGEPPIDLDVPTIRELAPSGGEGVGFRRGA